MTNQEAVMSIERRQDAGDVDARLREFSETANVAHRRVEAAARDMVQQVLVSGRALIDAKALVGHGRWLPWLEQNFEDSQRTAQLYMRLARNSATVADLPTIREAVAALTTPRMTSFERFGEYAREQAKEAYASGDDWPRLSREVVLWIAHRKWPDHQWCKEAAHATWPDCTCAWAEAAAS
jgi:hypothetical protein